MAHDAEELLAAGRARILAASTGTALEEARVATVGRSAPVVLALRGVGQLPPEERGPTGQRLNGVRRELEALLAEREAEIGARELEERLRADAVDVTLPARIVPHAGLHLLTQTRQEIEDVFIGLGYRVAEGPEVELEHNNFTALNIPDGHPAKNVSDTLWVADDVVLRTHTSPVQVRTMLASPPPVYVICPGRVYRRDTVDATHSAIFHQVEGLVVDRGITLGDLKGTLRHFARAMFGASREVRLRPGFFPFTEPSVELDVSCFLCDGAGCRVCKGTGWIEILGAGMVDPNVYGFIPGGAYDPEEITGFAFGMGIERIAMLRHGIPDIRMLYDDDLRVLEQFPS